MFKPENNVDAVVYLYREIESDKARDLPVSLGSDDTLTVWLNGEKIVSENVQRACTPDQTKAVLKLKQGVNKLLMKVCQGSGEWAFYFKASEGLPPAITWAFEDVSDAVGLGANGIGSKVKGDSLVVCDVNGDGRPDFLYSAGSGMLVLNTPGGFVEAKDSGISYKAGKVGPVFGDYDNDGLPDLFVPQKDGCKLFHNEGGGKFTDATAKAGLDKFTGWATSAAWGDVDNDGKLDLVIGCLRGPNRYFRGKGDGTFEDATEAIGLNQKVFNTQAVGLVDLNGDGVLDMVFNNEGQDSCVLLGNPEWAAKRTPVTLRVGGQDRRDRQQGEGDRQGRQAGGRAAGFGRRQSGRPVAADGAVRAGAGDVPRRGAVQQRRQASEGTGRGRRPRQGRHRRADAQGGLKKRYHHKDTKNTKKTRVRRKSAMRTGLAQKLFLSSLCALCVFVVNTSSAAEPGWTMYRGNAQRTGNVDGKPGPANPAVLWVHSSKEHFIASPTPAGDRVFFTGLGPFNVSTFYCFATAPKAEPRTLWTKTTPFIKMPSVSSPAVVGDKLIFGDGMHQTDGATLYCLSLATGRPLWQLPVPGVLVHLEGSPTVTNGRVYLGGGNAGVICVDMNRVTLEGKEMDLPSIQKILDKKWADLQAQLRGR